MTTFRDEENRSASYETGSYVELNTVRAVQRKTVKKQDRRGTNFSVILIRLHLCLHDAGQRERRCEEILSIQAMGLKKRLAAYGLQTCGDRPFRRSGLHAGSSGDGSGL